MHRSHIPDIKISDNDNNMSTSGDFDLMAQARKSCVVIKMGDHIKPQTDHMNGTEVTLQAAFEDVGWEPMVLETEAEKQAEWKKNSEWIDANTEPDQMTAEEKVAVKRQRERDLTQEHVRKHRALKKEQNPKPKKHKKTLTKCVRNRKLTFNFIISQQVLHDDANSPSELEDLADVSCNGSAWRLKHNGQQVRAKQSHHKCTDWCHPFLWPAIDEAACKTYWSPTKIEKHLKHLYLKLYNTICKSTISKWIDKETK
jgi:hypothetical protein